MNNDDIRLRQSVLHGAARSVLLAYASQGGTPFTAKWELVSDWQAPYGLPEPIDVRLSVRNPTPTASYVDGFPSLTTFPPPIVEGFCGQDCQAGSGSFPAMRVLLNAAWRITWGAGGEQRTMVCDLKTARYCLGACTRVTVEAMRWQDTPATPGDDFDIYASASVVPASGAQIDEPTCTMVNSFTTGQTVGQNILIPNFARWFVPMVDTRAGVADSLWGTAQPNIKFCDFGEAVLVSPSLQQITPAKHRYEVGQRWYDGNAYSQWGYIATASALIDDLQLGVRFYLSI